MAQTDTAASGLSDYLDALAQVDDMRKLGSFLRARGRVRVSFDSDDVAAAFARLQASLESLSERINAVGWRVDPTGRVVPELRGIPGEIYEAMPYYSRVRAIETARQAVMDGLRELLG